MRAFLVVLAISLLTTVVFAQTTGSISGTVADKDGAVVPGANVSVTNVTTKDVRTSTSNGEGFFSITGLTSGSYSIRIEANGFKTWETKGGIQILPGDKKSLNTITLQIGKKDEIVNVEASVLAVQITSTGDRASVLTSKDIKNLALEGRDVSELVRVLPGFSNTTGGGYGKAFSNSSGYDPSITGIGSSVGNGYSAAGTPFRGGGANITSDGANVIDPGCNCNATQTVNADMVAEVKVSTSTFSADSALGPVVVQAVSKSGTSQYNGSLYMHYRASTFNSNPYNLKASGAARPVTHYYYPGGQIGGPVRIPGTNFNKDNKFLFFAAFEDYRQTFPSSSDNGLMQVAVPTVSQRAGHFGPTNYADNATLINAMGAANGTWVEGYSADIASISDSTGTFDTITKSDISAYEGPGAAALMKLIPTPNYTPTSTTPYNYVKTLVGKDNGWMFHTQVTYNFSDTAKLNVNYNQQSDKANVPVMMWWTASASMPYPGDIWYQNISRTISVNFLKVLSPTLTNEFTGTYSFLNTPLVDDQASKLYRSTTGYPYATKLGESPRVPGFMNSWWASYFGLPTFYQGDTADGANAYYSKKYMPQVSDNITKIAGNHSMKTGFFWASTRNSQPNFNQQGGAAGFQYYAPNWSNMAAGQNVAGNFYLDYANSYYEETNVPLDMQYSSLGFFFQDDYKVNKKLTLNLGLRVTHDPHWADRHNGGVAVWSEEDYRTDVARGLTNGPGLRYHAKDSNTPQSGNSPNFLFFAPRFGMAIDLTGNGKNVLRGGFGAYYYHDQENYYTASATASEAQYIAQINTPGYLSWYDNTANVPAKSCIDAVAKDCVTNTASNWATVYSATNSAAYFSKFGGYVESASAIDKNDHNEPLTLTYNLQFDRTLPFGTLLDIAYSGNQSQHLPNAWTNINAIPMKSFFSADPISGATLSTIITGNESQLEEIVADGNATGSYRNDYRPWKYYNTLDVLRHQAWENWNSLQVTWQRTRGALNFNFNYTWSKMLGIDDSNNDDERDPINQNNDYGVLPQDRSHVFNGTISYEIGNHFKSNRILTNVLDGWMVSNITTIQSGGNMQAAYGGSRNFGLTAGYGCVDSTGAKANCPSTSTTDFGYQSAYNTATNISLLGSSDYRLMPNLTCDPTKGLGKHQYFNASCFSMPTTRGTNGRYQWPYIHGPAYWDSDLALQKSFKLSERQNLRLRLNAINFLNHPLWSFNSNAESNINLSFTHNYNVTTSTWGAYTQSTTPGTVLAKDKMGARVVELSLRYEF
jgi:hypothetical protein